MDYSSHEGFCRVYWLSGPRKDTLGDRTRACAQLQLSQVHTREQGIQEVNLGVAHSLTVYMRKMGPSRVAETGDKAGRQGES